MRKDNTRTKLLPEFYCTNGKWLGTLLLEEFKETANEKVDVCCFAGS